MANDDMAMPELITTFQLLVRDDQLHQDLFRYERADFCEGFAVRCTLAS